MRGVTCAAAALSLLGAGDAWATDFVSGRAGFTAGTAGGDARYALSGGGSFEANVAPDVVGVRVGADLVLGGWFSEGSGHSLGLRPELAFFPGADGARMRLFGTLRWHLAPIGLGSAEGHWLQALELGPELEWRHPGPSWFRLRLGAFFAPTRDTRGKWRWPQAALGFTVEYGPPLMAAVQVPKECVELPTRPCPQ